MTGAAGSRRTQAETGAAGSRRTQAERREATRGALLAAARALFAERGYAGVATEDIVQRAGVTRGALYHHFRGKDDVFAAAYEQIERELSERIAAGARGGEDPIQALRTGAATFLDACLDAEVQRIALLDAPSVLGWEIWREIGERYGLSLIHAALASAMHAGALATQPVRPLAHALLGALHELALFIARSDDVPTARREAGETLDRLLAALAAAG
jgi:AcrR family transcriptional regulator